MFRFTLICCLMHSFSSSSFFKWQSSRILNAWKKKSVSYVICYKVIYTYIKYIHMLTMKFGIFLVYKIFWWGTWVNIIHYTQILWCLISRIVWHAHLYLLSCNLKELFQMYFDCNVHSLPENKEVLVEFCS